MRQCGLLSSCLGILTILCLQPSIAYAMTGVGIFIELFIYPAMGIQIALLIWLAIQFFSDGLTTFPKVTFSLTCIILVYLAVMFIFLPISNYNDPLETVLSSTFLKLVLLWIGYGIPSLLTLGLIKLNERRQVKWQEKNLDLEKNEFRKKQGD